MSDDGYNLVREKEIKTKAEMFTSNRKNNDAAQDDAFDKVRQKESLKTKGEKLLEKKINVIVSQVSPFLRYF